MTESKLTTIPPTQLVTPAELPLLQSKNILVVEDDEDILTLIAIILEQAGASVTAVGSASAALVALQAHPYDLLLSDLAMPETDGWSLIRQVRALPAESGGKIPAAALTAYSTKRDRNVSLFHGFQILLAKPIEPDRLVADIVRLLGTHKSNPHPSDV